MNDKIIIKFDDLSTAEFAKNTKIIEIAKYYQTKMTNPIIGAKIDNEVIDMNNTISRDCAITFFDVNDLNGYKMYQAGIKFVMIAALKKLYGKFASVTFEQSANVGIMCYIKNGKTFDSEAIARLKEQMQQIINEDVVIEKLNISKKEAIAFYEATNENEKAINARNVSNSIVVLYKLYDNYNYFYNDMPYSTKVLSKFDFKYIADNQALLLFPTPRSNNEIPEYIHNEKIYEELSNSKEWIEKMNVKYISSFNENVNNGNIQEFIRMNELIFNSKIDNIAKSVLGKLDKVKMILVAGPSSSGKTTTTKRLSMFLKSNGIDVFPISVDDYFKERIETPTTEDGKYDYESINAIDIDLFNSQLLDLIAGKPVRLSRYDFLTGKKVFDEKETIINPNTVLLIEGLHCLNEKMTEKFDRSAKFKIYLSPFKPNSIDRHNYVSTEDLRLIRRMVRDNRTRGYDVSNTIKNWQMVRIGEEKYIYPYTNEADAVINTALVYELGVLKVYVEPLLYSVDVKSPYYEEARRLISFLKSFFPIPSEYVLEDSILREFIGGSIFK